MPSEKHYHLPCRVFRPLQCVGSKGKNNANPSRWSTEDKDRLDVQSGTLANKEGTILTDFEKLQLKKKKSPKEAHSGT